MERTVTAGPICLVETMPVYDLGDVERAMANAPDGPNGDVQRRMYQKMVEKGGSRFLTKPSSETNLQTLGDQCPNFQAVIEDLSRYVELSRFGQHGRFTFLPVLLAGDPGVGKTYFAKQLARALALTYQFVSLGTVTAGFVLSGSSAAWTGAKPGKIATALIDEDFANPLILLDEIDKSGGDARFDPMGCLLQLLERDTAKHFRDEYLDLPLNAGAIIWVATANDLSRVPDYILSRMAVYDVPAPTVEQGRIIAEQVFDSLILEHGWPFDPELSDDVLDVLGAVAPREMKKRLMDAMGSARLANRTHLEVADVTRMLTRQTKLSIGFTASI